MKRLLIGMLVVLASGLCLVPSTVIAQQKLVVLPLAERKVEELPAGPLFWRIENFAARAEAQAAAAPWALVAESAGKVWLFTLGPQGGSTAGATLVAEVGPIARVIAARYLLRINEASGPPGSMTPTHMHPGSESFYVLSGETSIRTSQGTKRIAAGHSATGHGADTPMQVSSGGSTDLLSLVMFVVDADKPFSSPAEIPQADKPGN